MRLLSLCYLQIVCDWPSKLTLRLDFMLVVWHHVFQIKCWKQICDLNSRMMLMTTTMIKLCVYGPNWIAFSVFQAIPKFCLRCRTSWCFVELRSSMAWEVPAQQQKKGTSWLQVALEAGRNLPCRYRTWWHLWENAQANEGIVRGGTCERMLRAEVRWWGSWLRDDILNIDSWESWLVRRELGCAPPAKALFGALPTPSFACLSLGRVFFSMLSSLGPLAAWAAHGHWPQLDHGIHWNHEKV